MVTANMVRKSVNSSSKSCHSIWTPKSDSCSRSIQMICRRTKKMKLWILMKSVLPSIMHFWIAMMSCSRESWISDSVAQLVWLSSLSVRSCFVQMWVILEELLSRKSMEMLQVSWLPRPYQEIRSHAKRMRLPESSSTVVESIPSEIKTRTQLDLWEYGWRTMTFRALPWQDHLETRLHPELAWQPNQKSLSSISALTTASLSLQVTVFGSSWATTTSPRLSCLTTSAKTRRKQPRPWYANPTWSGSKKRTTSSTTSHVWSCSSMSNCHNKSQTFTSSNNTSLSKTRAPARPKQPHQLAKTPPLSRRLNDGSSHEQIW